MAHSMRRHAPRAESTPSTDQPAPSAGGAAPATGAAGIGNTERTRRRLGPPDTQGASSGHADVTGLDEAGVCRNVDGVSGESQGRLVAFREQVRAALEPWREQRLTPNLLFDVGPLNSLAADFLTTWQRVEGSLPTELIREALDVGTIRSSLIEIAAFTPQLSGSYAAWLGFGPQDFPTHKYRLTTREGIQVGAIVTARSVPCTLTYENDHGMRWSVDGTLLVGGARAGAGLRRGPNGTEPNGEPGLGIELLPAGSPVQAEPTRTYFSPSDFGGASAFILEAEAVVEGGYTTGSGGSASEGIGASASGLALQANGRHLDFLTAGGGRTSGAGQSVTPPGAGETGAGITGRIGLGAALGGVVGEQAPVGDGTGVRQLDPAVPQASPDPDVTATAIVYFHTAEAALDGDDVATLQDLVQQMSRISEGFRDTVPEVRILGLASRQWRGARSADEALSRNEALAERRAEVVRRTLDAMYGDPEARFNTGVRQLIATEANHQVQGDGGVDANDEGYRAVEITAVFHPCRRDDHLESHRV